MSASGSSSPLCSQCLTNIMTFVPFVDANLTARKHRQVEPSWKSTCSEFISIQQEEQIKTGADEKTVSHKEKNWKLHSSWEKEQTWARKLDFPSWCLVHTNTSSNAVLMMWNQRKRIRGTRDQWEEIIQFHFDFQLSRRKCHSGRRRAQRRTK